MTVSDLAACVVPGLTAATSLYAISVRYRLWVAERDALTGLWRRGPYLRRAQRVINRGGEMVAVVDIDGLKEINDRFGHPGGDKAVREIGGMIRRTCGRGVVAGRIGGDELSLCGREDGVKRALASLRSVPVVLGEQVHLVGASSGLVKAGPGDRIDALIAAADSLLYRAKRERRLSGG